MKSEFLKNVATLFTGTILSQVLPIIFAPVMTRIFDPSDYGILALYMAVSGLMSVFITSHYTHAILIPRQNRDSVNIVIFCVFISFIFSIFSLIVFGIFGGHYFGLDGLLKTALAL